MIGHTRCKRTSGTGNKSLASANTVYDECNETCVILEIMRASACVCVCVCVCACKQGSGPGTATEQAASEPTDALSASLAIFSCRRHRIVYIYFFFPWLLSRALISASNVSVDSVDAMRKRLRPWSNVSLDMLMPENCWVSVEPLMYMHVHVIARDSRHVWL